MAKKKQQAKRDRQKKLPEVIYGHWRNDTGHSGDEFLSTDEDPESLVEKGETLRVGVYTLTGYADITNVTTSKTTVNPAGRKQ